MKTDGRKAALINIRRYLEKPAMQGFPIAVNPRFPMRVESRAVEARDGGLISSDTKSNEARTP